VTVRLPPRTTCAFSESFLARFQGRGANKKALVRLHLQSVATKRYISLELGFHIPAFENPNLQNMPRQLALLVCIGFILYLFRVDYKNSEGLSMALWVPTIWMFLAGSRYVSQWLAFRGPEVSSQDYSDGSPLDRMVFLILMIGGIAILRKRQLNWGELLRENQWIWLFFLFGAMSVLWSDYPFVSFKRWIKALGNVIMALVILTEERPYEAIGVVLRRLAIVMLPLSILFIKYYPDLGRTYHMGKPMFSGVASQKNGLGVICLMSSIYLCWSHLSYPKEVDKLPSRLPLHIDLMLLSMTAWLMYMANSATSIICTVLAVCIFLSGRLPFVAREPQRIFVYGVVCIMLFAIADIFFDATAAVITMLGRKPDLTTRVPMWRGLLEMAGSPIWGTGFESFWLGDRLDFLWTQYGALIQAHNGYLETYLNLGIVGLTIIVCTILAGFSKVKRYLSVDYWPAIFRLTFIIVVAFYNWTEASFSGVSNMWLLMFLGVIEIPRRS
jgi:exopolysaccharide production protein ExoQ